MISERNLNFVIQHLPTSKKDQIMRNIARKFCLLDSIKEGSKYKFKAKLTDKQNVENGQYLICSRKAKQILYITGYET